MMKRRRNYRKPLGATRRNASSLIPSFFPDFDVRSAPPRMGSGPRQKAKWKAWHHDG